MYINEIIATLSAEISLRAAAIAALERVLDGKDRELCAPEPEKIIQPGPGKPPEPFSPDALSKQLREALAQQVGTAKYCNQCHHMKPMSAYPANKNCKDGHEGVCKACRRPGKVAVGDDKLCKVCGQAKPPEAFPIAPYGRGRIATCAVCRVAAFKKTVAAKKATKVAASPKPISDGVLPPRPDPKNRCEECHAVFGSAAMLTEHRAIRHAG